MIRLFMRRTRPQIADAGVWTFSVGVSLGRRASTIVDGGTRPRDQTPQNVPRPGRAAQICYSTAAMPQSLHVLTAHIIFSTKERHRWLSKDIQARVWAYQSRILQNLECHSYPQEVSGALRRAVPVGLKLVCPSRARGVVSLGPGASAPVYYGSGLSAWRRG